MALTKVSNSMQSSASVSVKDFGAVGDGVTDDTVAIQAAIDFCYADPYNPKELLLIGKHYITSSLMIDDGISQSVLRNNVFRIKGNKDECGFYTDQAIVMISSNEDHSTQSQVRGITFENIAFLGDNTVASYVMDGAFIQVQFLNCFFNEIKCQTTTNVNTFSYLFSDCICQNWSGLFFELIYTSANDITFLNCYFNGNSNDGGAIRASIVQGLRVTNCTFEDMDGIPIILRGVRSCNISGNYFENVSAGSGNNYVIELNEAGTAELNGAFIAGNLFYLTSSQVSDANFYGIHWNSVTSGVSAGNWCLGKLHDIDSRQPNSDLAIMGDVESTTGDGEDRSPIVAPFRYTDQVLCNDLKLEPRSAAPSATAGRVYYDSDDNKLKVYNGTSWIDLH